MNIEVSKKLTSYLGVIATTVFTSNAAIIYTDVNPDVALNAPDSSSIYELDLNNDNSLDFIVRLDKYTDTYSNSNFTGQHAYFSVASSATGNYFLKETKPYSISTSTSGSFLSPIILNQGEGVKASDTRWKLPNSIQSNYSSSYGILGAYIKGTDSYNVYRNIKVGEWRGIEDKYVGLKVASGNDTIYGWVRLSVNTLLNSITIKDYAYGNAGENIKAGEGASSVTENNFFKPSYSLNNQILSINNLSELQKQFDQLKIINTAGKTILSSKIKPKINLQNVNDRIYIIQFVGKNNVYSDKINNQ